MSEFLTGRILLLRRFYFGIPFVEYEVQLDESAKKFE